MTYGFTHLDTMHIELKCVVDAEAKMIITSLTFSSVFPILNSISVGFKGSTDNDKIVLLYLTMLILGHCFS